MMQGFASRIRGVTVASPYCGTAPHARAMRADEKQLSAYLQAGVSQPQPLKLGYVPVAAQQDNRSAWSVVAGNARLCAP